MSTAQKPSLTPKPATTSQPIHPLLAERWSPVAFSERLIEPAILTSLMEAARWAPSCYNDQPWLYVYATIDQEDEHAKMSACLVEGNRIWAKHAPLLMISFSRGHFERNGKPNRFGQHDTGLATMSMVIEAMRHGLWTHQMGGIEVEKIKQIYGVPDGFEPMAGIAIGYRGDPDLPEKIKARESAERKRKTLDEIFWRDP